MTNHDHAKLYLFDNGISMETLQAAWDRALDPETGNPIIKNLAEHGQIPLDLPPHLIADLLKRYPEDDEASHQN